MDIQEKANEDSSSFAMSDLAKGEPEAQPRPQSLKSEHMPSSDDPKEEFRNTPPSALDWDSPEDPDNPQNWHFRSKIYHVTIPGLFGFVV
jgi:hypothetical protein